MNKVFIIIMMLACGLLTFLIVRSNNQLVEQSSLVKNADFQLNKLQGQIEGVRSSVIWATMSEGEFISNLDLTDEQGKMTSLQSLLSDKYTLVLNYSELNCSSCVEKQIKLLDKAIDAIGTKNVLICASYTNSRELLLFKRMNQVKVPIFNLGTSGLGIKAEEANSPIFFVLSNDLKINNVFLPLEYDPDLTNSYLDQVLEKYW